MITSAEKKLIGLDITDPLPSGGIDHQLYSFSGFGVDSTESWDWLSKNLRKTFDVDFYPGSLNIRRIDGLPWIPPKELDPQQIRLGVFHVSYALPIVLNENCVGIAVAVDIRGFDLSTNERILPPLEIRNT